MSKQTILVVDDEQHILELLDFNLKQEGYKVVLTMTGEEALELCKRETFSLALLDIMLPGIGGLDVCRKLKMNPQTANMPVLMLTARGEELDKVLGLELGADDYVTKPFGVRELMARVKALLRRAVAQTLSEPGDILSAGGVVLDCERYIALRDGRKLSLTIKEFDLLRLLVQNKGKVVTREMILDRIWGYEYMGETRTVDVHIRHIRQKLDDDGTLIETLRGVGYRLVDA